MDNGRRKYVHIESLSTGDILHCLNQLKVMMRGTLQI